MIKRNLFLILLSMVFLAGCGTKKIALSPNESALRGNVTKAVVILTQDDGFDNNKIIREGIAERIYRNSNFKKNKGGVLSVDIHVESTEENYGVYPLRATWKDRSGNICLEAQYPVDFNRCYGGRSFCAYINEMDSYTTHQSHPNCSEIDYNLAMADAIILHSPSADSFDVMDTYEDEAFERLSR